MATCGALRVFDWAGFKAEDYGEVGLGFCGADLETLLQIRAHQSLSIPSLSSNQER